MGISTLSGFTILKSFIVPEVLEAHVVTSEEVRMVTETTTGVKRRKSILWGKHFLLENSVLDTKSDEKESFATVYTGVWIR